MADQADLSLHCESRFFVVVVVYLFFFFFFFFFRAPTHFYICMISKIKSKIYVLGNKEMFLSIYFSVPLSLSSLSVAFFLYLRVTRES